VTWVTALILMALALPSLLARLAGGYPPNPVPELAALAPLGVLPAVAAVIIAAYAAWWLAALLAIPAVLLVMWQLPPLRRARFQAAPRPSPETGSATTLGLRLFTVNAQGGAADPAAIVRILQQHEVDVLAVQELTAPMVARLTAAGLTQVLPFSHLDPRPGSRGTGLWARWPLTPLSSVPNLTAAAPRARINPPGGLAVTLTAVHPRAPVLGHADSWRQADSWRRELAMIQQAVAAVDDPQVVAGDFNATRDHGPFRELLAAGFVDCADASQNRSWPGFTWPSLPVLRLDHVLVPRTATVPMARTMRVPRTDHHGVLVDIEFRPET
jgi:endonuclease/exonuclease/phosphatase (EEP) superfamily protein YafD